MITNLERSTNYAIVRATIGGYQSLYKNKAYEGSIIFWTNAIEAFITQAHQQKINFKFPEC